MLPWNLCLTKSATRVSTQGKKMCSAAQRERMQIDEKTKKLSAESELIISQETIWKKITSSVETKPQLKRHLYEAFEFSQRLLYYISSFCMLGSFCHQATSKLYLKPLPTWHSFFLFSMAYSRKVRSEEHGIFLIPDYNKDNIGAINIGLHVCLDVTIEYQPF